MPNQITSLVTGETLELSWELDPVYEFQDEPTKPLPANWSWQEAWNEYFTERMLQEVK